MRLEPLLYVSDLKASIQFYSEILGFKRGELYPNQENPSYASIFIGQNKLMLVAAREMNKKFCPQGLGGSGVQLFVQVDNVDVVWNKAKDQASVLDPIENKAWGDREFTIRDPDDYLISFYTPL